MTNGGAMTMPVRQPEFKWDPIKETWYAATPQISPEEFEQMLLRPTGLIGFFDQHPHFIPFIAYNMEMLLDGHFAKKQGWQVSLAQFQLNAWRQQYAGQAPILLEIDNIEKEMNMAMTAKPGIAQSLDLQSDHFLSQLTDTEIAVIQQLHQANHAIAEQAGYVEYNHTDPRQATAYYSAWGASNNQGGDWSTQMHTRPPYATQNNGFSNAPPNGMGDPWMYQNQPSQQQQTGPGLKGTLISAGLNFLTSGGDQNQQQQPYQPPPPNRPYPF